MKHIRTFNTITINGYKYKQYKQCNGTKHLGFITCGLYNINTTKDDKLQGSDMAYTCHGFKLPLIWPIYRIVT